MQNTTMLPQRPRRWHQPLGQERTDPLPLGLGTVVSYSASLVEKRAGLLARYINCLLAECLTPELQLTLRIVFGAGRVS